MKKKSVMAVNALLAAALLCACAPQSGQMDTTETTVQATVVSETTVEAVETQASADTVQSEFQWQDTAAHHAFRRTLKTIHDELYFPKLAMQISLWEPGTIEDETFAVADVDGDGEEELLVGISNTYIAGMCKVVYGYDQEKDDVREEACTWSSATFYPGMIQVSASHNHGHAGDVLWPYSILTYDKQEDAYQDTFYVDAWSKEIADYDANLEMAYPEEVDTAHDGFVYLITENGRQRIINRQDYEKWEAEFFAGKEPIAVAWQKMTAENIGLEIRKAADIARWGQDELLHQADFELRVGKPGKVRLFGKQLDAYFYGASDAVVELEDGHAIPVEIQDGLMRWLGQSNIHYTESYDQTCGLILEDVNFDGYTDIGLQVQVTAYHAPYVYWYYDPDADAYRFLNGFCCPLEVNRETERCTEEYHEGQTYYKVIYKVREHLLVPEERWITEYIDGRPVTTKEE